MPSVTPSASAVLVAATEELGEAELLGDPVNALLLSLSESSDSLRSEHSGVRNSEDHFDSLAFL